MITKKKHDELHVFDLHLSEGESILWTGRPNPSSLFSPSDILLIPFSLMWGGFSIFWELGALGGGPSLFALWGIPFVVVGQYFIWGRFLHKYLRRQKTFYAITEQRAIILDNFLGTHLKTYFVHKVSSLQRQPQSVLFELSDSSPMQKRNWQDWSGESQPGFYALSDVDNVYRLLQDLIVQSR